MFSFFFFFYVHLLILNCSVLFTILCGNPFMQDGHVRQFPLPFTFSLMQHSIYHECLRCLYSSIICLAFNRRCQHHAQVVRVPKEMEGCSQCDFCSMLPSTARGACIRDPSASASIVFEDIVCFLFFFLFKDMQELHSAPRRLYFLFIAFYRCPMNPSYFNETQWNGFLIRN